MYKVAYLFTAVSSLKVIFNLGFPMYSVTVLLQIQRENATFW